jgi:hypothetical protein
MSLAFTRTNFVTGTYTGDVLLLLEAAENNALRQTSSPNAAVGVQIDSVGRAFIGYGYDLQANASTAIADLSAAGAVISNVAALQAAINALPPKGTTPTTAQIATVSALVSLPNAASAALLLNNTIANREASFNQYLTSFGLPAEPATEERAALMDMWYQTPAYFQKTITNAQGIVIGHTPTRLTQALQSGNRAAAWFEIRYGSSSNGTQGIQDGTSKVTIDGSYRIDLSLVQPIFPFLAERSAVDKAKAEVRRAEALTTEAKNEADSKLRMAVSASEEATSSYRAARASMEEAERVLMLTESLYKAGRTNLDEFEHAEIDLQKSLAEVETLASQKARSAWDLERALQATTFPTQLMNRLGIELADEYLQDGI